MNRIAIAVALLLGVAPMAIAQSFSSLEEKMSAAEFDAAGLDKLSPEELAALNAWLRTHAGSAPASGALPATPSALDDRRGFPAETASGDIISTIPGEFRGWRGKGVRIKLANGQIWETNDSSSRLAVKLNNPVVRIEPGVWGAWYLSVDGYNTTVQVKRIK